MSRVAPWFERVAGVDADASAIALAADKLRGFPNCEPRRVEAEELPFAAGTFEVATSADVIEHLKDPDAHLREIARVLAPGGALVLTTPQWKAGGPWDPRHEKEYRAEELRELLATRFPQVEMRYCWPRMWSRFYETRAGWRILKLMAIQLYNPFLGSSDRQPERYDQLLAVCRNGS